MTAARQDELWGRWRPGEPISVIARNLEMPPQHVQRFLAQTGGVPQPAARRHAQHLTLAEREEISRGVAMGCSAREIAGFLGRSGSGDVRIGEF